MLSFPNKKMKNKKKELMTFTCAYFEFPAAQGTEEESTASHFEDLSWSSGSYRHYVGWCRVKRLTDMCLSGW